MSSSRRARRQQLRELLDSAQNTAEFLQDVQSAIETLYADSDGDGCPDGFTALDEAIEAFEACEGEGDEEE